MTSREFNDMEARQQIQPDPDDERNAAMRRGQLEQMEAAALPPDPDGENERRRDRAAFALGDYMQDENDEETALTDLLSDLRHWADRYHIDFEDALDRAFNHYTAETTE